jgi:hypothetical protein
MIKLPWIDRFPDKNLQNSFELLEKVYWNISVVKAEPKWSVYAGKALIFQTDSQAAFEAFLYGSGLTYVSIDRAIVDAYREELRKWVE